MIGTIVNNMSKTSAGIMNAYAVIVLCNFLFPIKTSTLNPLYKAFPLMTLGETPKNHITEEAYLHLPLPDQELSAYLHH